MRAVIIRITIVVSVASLALIPAVGGVFAQESAVPEGQPGEQAEKLTFTVGTTSDLTSTNPFKGCCYTDYEMMLLSYDLLHNYNPDDLTSAPGLAESYDVSEDGKTWTFKIREGVMWSDGTPLTAKDIAFTYNFVKNNRGTGAFNNYIGVPKAFSAPDDTTFVWEMEEATGAPLLPPFVPILPQHIWKGLDGKEPAEILAFDNVPTVSSGAFFLDEWKPGEFFRMRANKEYWGGAPIIDEVVFRIFENQEAMVQALKSGEIDAAEAIEPNLFDSLKHDPTIEAVVTNEIAVYNLAFNLKQGKNAAPAYGDTLSTGHPALQDVDVRRAIAHSIDKQTLVDVVASGYGSVADSFLMPVFAKWYNPAEGEQVHGFDIERANELYDQGGYLDTNGDGIREMPGGGQPFEFDLVAIADDHYSMDSARLIKGWMEETGWKVKLIPASETRALELWGTSDFDAYVWYWDGDPDPDFMTSIFTTEQCGNWSDGCYSNQEMDRLYELQRTQSDVAERQETVFQMQDLFYEDVPEVMTFYIRDTQAYRKDRWTGFVNQPAPSGSVIYGWGPYSYQQIRPVEDGADVATAGPSSDAGGIPGFLWVALIVGAVVVAIGIGVSRRKDEEDKV